MTHEEWLGELVFVHYTTTLSKLTEFDFTRSWHTLMLWEKQAWIEAASAVVEAANAKPLTA
jgi:hypothetical protein